MDHSEAARIVQRQNQAASWKELDEDVLVDRAVELADLLDDCPAGWAWNWFMAQMRTGVVPTDMQIVAAWSKVRPNPFAGEPTYGDAPLEVRQDYATWRAWETARRDAIRAGRHGADADAAADQALGVVRKPAPTPPAGMTWREVALRGMRAAQEQHAAAADAARVAADALTADLTGGVR